jgi:hypothetical protein
LKERLDKICGISQNPDTKVYILVFNDKYLNNYCKKCDNYGSWCKTCQINQLKNNFTNWTSGNMRIDEFIQKMQLKINKDDTIVFEWIPYNQFIDVKEIEKGSFATALQRDGSLYYSKLNKKYIRKLNEKVLLKYFHNSQNIINAFSNEVCFFLKFF